jgi:hypothetical protein
MTICKHGVTVALLVIYLTAVAVKQTTASTSKFFLLLAALSASETEPVADFQATNELAVKQLFFV